MLDDLLKKLGLKYEDLTAQEKETYRQMAESLSTSQITPERLRDYIIQMKASVELELVDEPELVWWFIPNRRHISLKARLKNYLLFESFLLSPERARKAVENALGKK